MASNRRDYYLNKRSWLIDTAETPEDQKNLKRDLAKLDAKFYPNRISKTKPVVKKDVVKKATARKVAVKPTVKKKAGKK